MPRGNVYAFADHVLDEEGKATDCVLATCVGGFAISEDLGGHWRPVVLPQFSRFAVVNARMLPTREVLLQAIEPNQSVPRPAEMVHLIVVDLEGRVLHRTKLEGARWHGPRAIDISGNTLMYAEYMRNGARRGPVPRKASRVFRSRDFGRSWEMVREEPAIRHFHLLQARPRVAGEWWLASGDGETESRIWKSVDDGDQWVDQTAAFGQTVTIDGLKLSRRLFRLTDLMWDDPDIVWGCDDALLKATHISGEPPSSVPGSRVFRGNPASRRPPEILGVCGPAIRNIVQLEDSCLLLTQASPFGDFTPPQVFLLPDNRAEPLHLFNVGRYSLKGAGFTLSRASRSARNGVFFSYCPPMQVFNSANQILRWDVEFA